MRRCRGIRLGEEEIGIERITSIKIHDGGICEVKYIEGDPGVIFKEIRARTRMEQLEFIYEGREE